MTTSAPTIDSQLFTDYVEGTARTWNHKPIVAAYHFELLNAALGTAGEGAELLETVERAIDWTSAAFVADLHSELGDVLYYVARVTSFLNLSFTTLATDATLDVEAAFGFGTTSDDVSLSEIAKDLAVSTGKVAEYVKKEVFHGKTKSAAEWEDVVFNILYDAATLAYRTDTTLTAVATANLDKLAARYPAGFTAGGGIRA